jgi:putative nucleotidyltransferase with HDIG domain
VIQVDIVDVFLEILKFKSTMLYCHSIEVAEIVKDIGAVIGYQEQKCIELETAGLLHDIGKIFLRDSIINKPDKLLPGEMEQIKMHPIIAAKMLENINNEITISDIILYHHENADGTGYYGLGEKEIPFESKILRIADTFSAMSMDRPYKFAYPVEVCAEQAVELFDIGIEKKKLKEILIENKEKRLNNQYRKKHIEIIKPKCKD